MPRGKAKLVCAHPTHKPAQRIILSTDKNGLVALRPLIGTTEGLIRIQAQALKLEIGNVNTPADLTGNATFLIQAKTAADGPASFTGQVFDDKSKPLPGIKVSIGRTALVSTTDSEGKFELNNIPPGRIDLFIDGRTYNPSLDAARAQYPSLHFEAYAVKGRINQIAHPIYLPPLATSPESAKQVGGNTDVILTIPGLQGFAMKVKANSVTFPDGSKTGLLIVSPVTADKLPMSPPAGGATFGVPAWTIQPAGTRFDPPIEVSLPNAGGYPAGDNLPIVQWDHDLGQYVAMGRATVSEDGALLITDSGSGLTKAGWGGLCRYDPDKCGQKEPPKCKDCESLFTGSGQCPTCYSDVGKDGAKCDGDLCKTCQGGACRVDAALDGKKAPDTVRVSVAAERELELGKGFFSKLAGKIGLPETKIVSKYGVQGYVEEICCGASNGRSKNLTIPSVFITGEFQAVGRVPGFSTPPILDEFIKAGLFVKVKIGLTGSGSYKKNLCTDKTCDGLALTASLTGSVEGDLVIEQGEIIPKEERVKLNLLAVGGGVGGTLSCVGESCRAAGNVFYFVKSEATFGTRKYVLWNWGDSYEFYQIPLSGRADCASLDSLVGATN